MVGSTPTIRGVDLGRRPKGQAGKKTNKVRRRQPIGVTPIPKCHDVITVNGVKVL